MFIFSVLVSHKSLLLFSGDKSDDGAESAVVLGMSCVISIEIQVHMFNYLWAL